MNNIYNAIQNLYNMDKTTWQEVLAELYNLVSKSENKFDLFEVKFGSLLGEQVTRELKKMYDNGTLASLINDMLLKDINKKVDTFISEVSEQLEHIESEKANDININQESFVELCKRHNILKDTFSVACTNLAGTRFAIVQQFLNGKYLEYNTGKSSIDGYTRFEEGKVGTLTQNHIINDYSDMDSKTGTWVTTATPNWYTTEVGATMTIEFFGSGLDLQLYTDARGGVWKFVVNDDSNNPINISTWNSENKLKTLQIFRKTTNQQLKVVATFTGADPLHAPSDGTARGWCYGGGDGNFKTFIKYKAIDVVNAENTLLYGNSNKEFAFSMRKNGTNNPYYFTPLHGTTPTAIPISTKFIVDGVEKTFSQGEQVDNVKEFQMYQQVYGKNPESENLVKITTMTTFRNDGVVNIDGKIEFLVDTDIQTAYGIMIPFNKEFTDYIVSSISGKHETNKANGTNEYLTIDKDNCTSFIALSETNKNLAVACDFLNPKQTLRQGATNKNSEEKRAWIEHRDSTVVKVYQGVYSNCTVKAGEVYKFSGSFIIANFEGVAELI